MVNPTFYLPLAKAAEDAGYDGMVVPDSICYPLESDSTYPFSPDHTREFLDDKPFIEPFSIIPAMGTVTERIRFITFVLKLPMRHPLLVAKQATSTAVMTGQPTGARGRKQPLAGRTTNSATSPWERRGRRMDEAIDIVRGLSAGGYFEYRGKITTCPPIKITPTPSRAVADHGRRSCAVPHYGGRLARTAGSMAVAIRQTFPGPSGSSTRIREKEGTSRP